MCGRRAIQVIFQPRGACDSATTVDKSPTESPHGLRWFEVAYWVLLAGARRSLEIEFRGTPAVIRADVGHRPTCLFWLHTHDDTGLIHIEADVPANYTLGQFFTVWGRPLSHDQVLDARVGAGEEVRVLVNGQTYSGDPRAVPLSAHELIVVQLGPPFPAPVPFTLPPGS